MSIETFLVNKKIAKDVKQAEKIMIGFVILCFVFLFVKRVTKKDTPTQLSPEQMQEFQIELPPGVDPELMIQES